MATQIPVLCNTPGCGTVWFTGSFFDIPDGAEMEMEQVAVLGCPVCKGVGRIPNGTYTNLTADILNPAEARLVLPALEALREKLAQGATREEIKQEIEEHYPFLAAILKFAPKTPEAMAGYLGVLVMAAQLGVMLTAGATPIQVQIQLDVAQGLAQVQSDLRTSQQKSHIGQPAIPPLSEQAALPAPSLAVATPERQSSSADPPAAVGHKKSLRQAASVVKKLKPLRSKKKRQRKKEQHKTAAATERTF
jgi:hypothetical protein